MGTIHGAALLAQTLRLADVGPVFTLSGNQILPIYDAGIDAGLRFIDTRHEAAAVHMADAWGRLTGQPGVCLVTAGPGHTNALTAVATAWMAESPVLLLSGGCDYADLGKGGFQEIDQIGVITPLCKQAWMASSAVELPALVARAYRVTREGTPGPVHITLPFDILTQEVAESTVAVPSPSHFDPLRRSADPSDVARVIDLLAAAERPILLGGPSAWRGQSGERLRAIADLTGAPALLIDNPRGMADPSFRGAGGLMNRADLVLLLTTQDFTVNFLRPPTFSQAVRLVEICPDGNLLGRHRLPDIGLIGDATTVLGQLLAEARTRNWKASAWRDELEELRSENVAALEPQETTDAFPLHPLRVVAAVRDLLSAGDCVTMDGGEFAQWARWGLAGGPYQFLTNGKLGGIGSGIPIAMAAALARPGRRSIAFVGDGTFGFHAMEFDTAVRHKIPFVVVVGNDAGWAAERHRQSRLYGLDRVIAADLLPTRYDQVARALGACGEHVERPEELTPALERAFESGQPTCINVAIASVPSPSSTH